MAKNWNISVIMRIFLQLSIGDILLWIFLQLSIGDILMWCLPWEKWQVSIGVYIVTLPCEDGTLENSHPYCLDVCTIGKRSITKKLADPEDVMWWSTKHAVDWAEQCDNAAYLVDDRFLVQLGRDIKAYRFYDQLPQLE